MLYWKKMAFISFIPVVALILWFIYSIITDKPPEFFPLDDSSAEYRITKKCPSGQGWLEQDIPQDKAFCLEYRGPKVAMKTDHDNSEYFSITIGQSKVELNPLLNKKVKNIQGNFTSSSSQCIQSQCVNIGGPYVVVNIDKVESE